MNIAGLMIAALIFAAISWMVWSFWTNNVQLNSRLLNGDLTLLESPQYNISEVIRAPAGSVIQDVNTTPQPGVGDGYVRAQLPDGRIALIPVASIQRPVKSGPATTHNNPPLQ